MVSLFTYLRRSMLEPLRRKELPSINYDAHELGGQLALALWIEA